MVFIGAEENDNIKKYVVYKHTAPNGKIYIGITGQTTAKRWIRGKGYRKNKHFFSAIEKYGWDNFTHEILLYDLTKEEAETEEKRLIAELKSNDPKYGYNQSTGGESGAAGVKRNAETRAKMSKAKKGTKQSPETIKRRLETQFAKRQNGGKSYALEEILEHLDDIEKWAREGATEKQMARCFGISRQTFSKYKNDNIDIFNAIKKGRTELVEKLKGTLIKKAEGFQYTEGKTIEELDPNTGRLIVTRKETYTRTALPDVAALNLLLKNYDRENWANDPQLLELKKEELEIQKKKAEDAAW